MLNLFKNNFKITSIRKFSTLIIPEIINNKLHPSIYNLVTAANNIDEDIHVLLYKESNEFSNLISQTKKLPFIKKILTYDNKVLNNQCPEYLANIIESIQKIKNYDNIISSSNNFGKDFIPRAAGLLDIQPLNDVCKIEKKFFYRYLYAGNVLSKFESNQKPNILTIRLTSFDKCKESENNAEVENLSSNIDIRDIKSIQFIENMTPNSDKIDLGAAKVVISGGRALKNKENFKLLEDLASCFDSAAIGASRAAVDAGYVPNELQIGQTGKVVAPDLYIAIGISGAIQHVAGIKDSKVIVAINNDGDSPIFNISTYGLVGDLFKILPELTDKLKQKKMNKN